MAVLVMITQVEQPNSRLHCHDQDEAAWEKLQAQKAKLQGKLESQA